MDTRDPAPHSGTHLSFAKEEDAAGSGVDVGGDAGADGSADGGEGKPTVGVDDGADGRALGGEGSAGVPVAATVAAADAAAAAAAGSTMSSMHTRCPKGCMIGGGTEGSAA